MQCCGLFLCCGNDELYGLIMWSPWWFVVWWDVGLWCSVVYLCGDVTVCCGIMVWWCGLVLCGVWCCGGRMW